jgi:hypothetical protein
MLIQKMGKIILFMVLILSIVFGFVELHTQNVVDKYKVPSSDSIYWTPINSEESVKNDGQKSISTFIPLHQGTLDEITATQSNLGLRCEEVNLGPYPNIVGCLSIYNRESVFSMYKFENYQLGTSNLKSAHVSLHILGLNHIDQLKVEIANADWDKKDILFLNGRYLNGDKEQQKGLTLKQYPPRHLGDLEPDSIIKIDVTDVVKDRDSFSIKISSENKCDHDQIVFLNAIAYLHLQIVQ